MIPVVEVVDDLAAVEAAEGKEGGAGAAAAAAADGAGNAGAGHLPQQHAQGPHVATARPLVLMVKCVKCVRQTDRQTCRRIFGENPRHRILIL